MVAEQSRLAYAHRRQSGQGTIVEHGGDDWAEDHESIVAARTGLVVVGRWVGVIKVGSNMPCRWLTKLQICLLLF